MMPASALPRQRCPADSAGSAAGFAGLIGTVPLPLWCILALLGGAAMSMLSYLAGGAALAMLALPCALLALTALCASPRHVVYAILLARAAGDGVLEALRNRLGEQAMGLGAVLNACMIIGAALLVLRAPERFPRPLATAWAAFLLAGLIGIVQAPHRADAVRLCLTWATNFAVLTVAWHLCSERAQVRACLRLIVYASSAPALYAVYELAAAGTGVRIKSTFMHANVFAFYLVLVIQVGFYLLKTRAAAARGSAVLTLYLLLLALLLVTTQTRSAWIACLLLFAAYGALFERRYLAYLVVASLVLACIPAVRERIVDLDDAATLGAAAELNSFAWRLALWRAGLDAMELPRMLLGYGLGAFRDGSARFFSQSAGIHWDAHNVYVQLLFDLGLAGLAAYLWLQWQLARRCAALWARERRAGFLGGALVLFYALCAGSDNMLFYLSLNWYYWLALGALLAGVAGQTPAPERAGMAASGTLP